MNRRQLMQRSALISAGIALPHRAIAQTPKATPQAPQPPEDHPVDPRARELADRLSGVSPLAVLEALESAEVTVPPLSNAADGAPVNARPWNDPSDTDLEHALGGVLIVASDDPVNSPDLVTLGAYIVFESPEIAFHVFTRQLDGNDEERLGSTSFAGTKAWIMTSGDMMLAVMRIGYVMIVAADPMAQHSAGEGLIEHLDTVARSIG